MEKENHRRKADVKKDGGRLESEGQLLSRDYEIHSDFITAKQECAESRELTPRIAFGKAAPKDMFPWMVAIYQLVKYSPAEEPFLQSDTCFICGGSLITPNFILTAAHCFLNKGRLNIGFKEVMVRLGDYNIQSPLDDEERKVRNSNVSALFVRQDYDQFDYENDIALLQLSQRMVYTPFIRPICVPQLNWKPDAITDDVIVAGWGYQYPDYAYPSAFSAALRIATLAVYQSHRCEYVIKYPLDPQRTICVANYGPNSSRTCTGDSGSPLNPMSDGMVMSVVIGLLSYGPKHCLQPSIFTNVQFYSNWINAIVTENNN